MTPTIESPAIRTLRMQYDELAARIPGDPLVTTIAGVLALEDESLAAAMSARIAAHVSDEARAMPAIRKQIVAELARTKPTLCLALDVIPNPRDTGAYLTEPSYRYALLSGRKDAVAVVLARAEDLTTHLRSAAIFAAITEGGRDAPNVLANRPLNDWRVAALAAAAHLERTL